MISDMSHPIVGETWLYHGRPVRITGGVYQTDRPDGILRTYNYWMFRYVNEDGTLGEAGGTYDNDPSKFFRSVWPRAK